MTTFPFPPVTLGAMGIGATGEHEVHRALDETGHKHTHALTYTQDRYTNKPIYTNNHYALYGEHSLYGLPVAVVKVLSTENLPLNMKGQSLL